MSEPEQFGDWEPADSIVADNRPDPEYVARRLHEDRNWLEEMAGMGPGPDWDHLEPDEQEVAIALGTTLTKHLTEKGRDGSALSLHEARQFLRDEPNWPDLDADTQKVALAIGDDIVRWLQAEGTVIA